MAEETTDGVVKNVERVLSEEQKEMMAALHALGRDLHNLLERLGVSREISLARTKTEEAVMWAVKHITG